MDDSILKVLAWQMKLDSRPHDKGYICLGCKNNYLTNHHLISCEKMKMKYRDQTKDIIDRLAEYKLDYKLNDIFKDYGMKKLVKTTRKKMEEIGEARNRSNSII